MVKKPLTILAIAATLFTGSLIANEAIKTSGIVNFATCVTESKYGKYEQKQMENLRNQWISLISETEKELKEISAKFEDQDYLDGLSPEAEADLKAKFKALNEDMNKYQNQLYQVLNQANYFFVQKMSETIAKASEKVASTMKLNVVINKEACFYYKPDLEITNTVIQEMDKTYDDDIKSNKISENDISSKLEGLKPPKALLDAMNKKQVSVQEPAANAETKAVDAIAQKAEVTEPAKETVAAKEESKVVEIEKKEIAQNTENKTEVKEEVKK